MNLNLNKNKSATVTLHYLLLVAVAVFFVAASIPNASALAIQNYDESSQIVSLKSLPFFWNTIADIKLVSNTYQCTDCSAVIKVNPNTDGNIADFDWSFYEVTGNNIFGRTETQLDNLDTYKLNNIKLSISKDSSSWEPLSNQDIIKGEEFYIMLEGHKDPFTTIDWVPTMFSATLDVWALWNAFNDTLTSNNLTLNVYSNSMCYQESANVSNQTGIDAGNCGLNYNGNYTLNGYSSTSIDGSVTTKEYIWATADFKINYVKPIGATSAIWTVTGATFAPTLNITLPSSCFNYGPSIYLMINSSFTTNTGYCKNSTDWVYLLDTTTYWFAEEAMIWNVSSYSNTTYLSIYKNANVTRATMNISGYNFTYMNNSYLEVGTPDGIHEWDASSYLFGNGSDGVLIFTNTVKSYGNLVAGIDYSNTSNTLYLRTDRVYNFVNFTLGAGMNLSTQNTTGIGLDIRATNLINITGQVNLSGVFDTGGYNGSGNGSAGGSQNVAPASSGGIKGIGGNRYGGGGGGGTVYSATGGAGGNGYNSSIVGGTADSIAPTGSYTTDPGNPGYNSGGGSGACMAGGAGKTGSCTQGSGGNTFGTNGGNGVVGVDYAGAGGGGGAGGISGKSGASLVLRGSNIIFASGSVINLNGSNGGNGGNGGNGASVANGIANVACGGGGGGGGGGTGGDGGNLYLSYNSLINNGLINEFNGLGGTGGNGGTASSTNYGASTCANGTSGLAGDNGISGNNFSINSYNFATNDFSTKLNSILTAGCTCTGCSLSAQNCTIPFTFYSDTIGILEYSDINITTSESIQTTPDIPATYHNSTINNPTFYCNSSFSSLSAENVTLYIWNATNGTAYTNTVQLDTNTSARNSFTTSALNDSSYYWGCFAEGMSYDNILYSAWGPSNYTFSINTTPYIGFVSPTPVDRYNSSYNTLYINVTYNNTYFSNITFSLYNSSGLYSSNFSTDSSQTFYNFTNISRDDYYAYNVTIWTTTGQVNYTSTRYWNLSTIPFIGFVNPTPPNTYNSTHNSLYINVTFNQTYFNNISFDVYNLSGLYSNYFNASLITFHNFTSMPDGNYTYNVTVTTTTGNINTTATRNLTIDISAPVINISLPTGTFNIPPPNSFDLNYTASDVSLKNCSYSYNGAANISHSCSVNFTGINFTLLGLNSITLYTNDTLGNINSSTRSFYVYPRFARCNDTYTKQILNFSFIDESPPNSEMNASIDLFEVVHWYDSQNSNTTYLFSNATENYGANTTFCIYPNWTANISMTFNIYYASDTFSSTLTYPQRIYTIAPTTYLNTSVTKIVLYLLDSTTGRFSTYIVQSSGGKLIPGALIQVEKQISGVWTLITQGTTDDAGSKAFWLDWHFPHRFTTTATGYSPSVLIITPTEATYTIVLGGASNLLYYDGITEGLTYGAYPPAGIMAPGTYNFSFVAYHSQGTLQNCSINLLNKTRAIVNSSYGWTNASECSVSILNYPFTGTTYGKYSVLINGSWIVLEADARWMYVNGSNPNGTGLNLKDVFKTAYDMPEWGDNEETRDFSRIVFFFFLMIIILSAINFYFNYDTLYPGALFYILVAMILFGSFADGFLGQGFFYMEVTNWPVTNSTSWNSTDVTPEGGGALYTGITIVNNFIFAALAVMMMISIAMAHYRRNEG